MLTDEEKKKIEEEERYKLEVRNTVKEEEAAQKAKDDADANTTGCIGCLTIIVGIAFYTWVTT